MANDMKYIRKLKALREKVNWGIEREQYRLLHKFSYLINEWKGQLPNLRDIFRREEIDWLLTAEVLDAENSHLYVSDGIPLIYFVIRTGYKDKPEVGNDGKLIFRRTTALHWAAKCNHDFIVPKLFQIYDRFDVNYTDDDDLTHFHVACQFECYDVIEKFLQLGQDPNCLTEKSNENEFYPPLHLALRSANTKLSNLLLRRGGDPNLTDNLGMTALHIISSKKDLNGFAKMLFDICDEVNRPVLVVDVRDKLGQTPLQLAMKNLLLDVVDVLLARGADLSGIAFPTEAHLDKSFKKVGRLEFVSGTLKIVECLEKKGHELNQGGALMIMNYFDRHGMFEKSAGLEKCWYNDEMFTSKAKRTMLNQNLSLYDLIRMQPEEVVKLVTHADCLKLEKYNDWWKFPKGSTCIGYLCEIMSRDFCRQWAIESFLELTRHRLTIDCCEVIIGKLKNEDLLRICQATEIVANEQSQNM